MVGLLAVLLVLLLVRRRERLVAPRLGRAWVPVVPIALATGWSALVLWLLRRAAQPAVGDARRARAGDLDRVRGAAVGALRGRARGRPRARPRRSAAPTARPAPAVLASGATAIAGFAVLALSDVRMLRDFGLVTVVDLTVSLLGVLIVLPAVLVLRRAPRRGAGAAPGERGASRPLASA